MSFKIAGTKTLEDGRVVAYEWPDKNEWKPDDFKYIQSRFESCKNLYAKSEYGLLLNYSGNLKNKDEVVQLLNVLFDLANIYLKKSFPDDDKERYLLHFLVTMINAFYIANYRKNVPEIQIIYEKLIRFTTDVHNSWDITHKGTLRSIIDLTQFAVDYKNDFQKVVDLKNYLDQNFKAANQLAQTDNWAAIYVCDISQKLADTIGDTIYDWQTLKAEQFEAMAQQNIDQGNLAAISFVESALSIYKKNDNKQKVAELSKQYQDVRQIFQLNEVRQELPNEVSKKIRKNIEKEVAEKNSRQLIEVLCISPMYSPIDKVKTAADEFYKQNTFSKYFPTSIIDKYGNTVDIFIDEEEKYKFNFWQSYDFQFQLGTQTLVQLFIEGFKADKFSYDSIISFISQTWVGKTYDELYNGHPYKITPLNVVSPGLKSFFDELEKWKVGNSFPVNFVCSTDSLVTKSEYLLRFFCRLTGIPTFVDKIKNGHKIKMEKNLDELLSSLKNSDGNSSNFSEDHRIFIKFVLTQKMGYNLRHRIAHGLMDVHEYDLPNPLLVLVIILKLSAYTFNTVNNDTR